MSLQRDPLTMAKTILASAARSGLGRSDQPEDLMQALLLSTRAAHLLALHKIQAVRAKFPATLQALLSQPDPAIEVTRDAFTEPRDFICFDDLLDLLSAEALPCTAPRLHRGWQDKKQSCRDARKITAGAVGLSLQPDERDALLEGWALQNRFFFMPPPLQLSADQVVRCLPPVLGLIKRLAPDELADEIAHSLEEIMKSR